MLTTMSRAILFY